MGGGSAINLPGIAADLADLAEPAVVVHGANALRDELAERLGAPKRVLTSVSGYSSVYSDDRALDMIMLAYAGLRNTRLVELCQRAGVNAIGLTGLEFIIAFLQAYVFTILSCVYLNDALHMH